MCFKRSICFGGLRKCEYRFLYTHLHNYPKSTVHMHQMYFLHTFLLRIESIRTKTTPKNSWKFSYIWKDRSGGLCKCEYNNNLFTLAYYSKNFVPYGQKVAYITFSCKWELCNPLVFWKLVKMLPLIFGLNEPFRSLYRIGTRHIPLKYII